jgi:hypothetical protein
MHFDLALEEVNECIILHGRYCGAKNGEGSPTKIFNDSLDSLWIILGTGVVPNFG